MPAAPAPQARRGTASPDKTGGRRMTLQTAAANADHASAASGSSFYAAMRMLPAKLPSIYGAASKRTIAAAVAAVTARAPGPMAATSSARTCSRCSAAT